MTRAVRARRRCCRCARAAPAAAQTPAVGGGSFNAAPLLEPGDLPRHGPAAASSSTTAIPLAAGQRLHVRVRVRGADPGDLGRGRRPVHDQPAHAAARGRHAGRRRGRGRQRQHERGDRRHRPRVGAAPALGLLRPARRAVRGGRGEQLDLRGPGHLVRVAAPGLGRRAAADRAAGRARARARRQRRRTSRPTRGPRRRRRRRHAGARRTTAAAARACPRCSASGAAGLAAGLVLARVLARR